MKKQVKILSVRADGLWFGWADRLAKQAGLKNRSEFIRDLVLACTILPDLGDTICKVIHTEGVHYGDR
jgi:hypothetical protein